MGIRPFVTSALAVVATAACGGGGAKKTAAKPETHDTAKKPPPPPETEADREAKRHAQAVALVPDGSSCLPPSLRDNGAPQLDIAAVGDDAVLCATDVDKSRLLGPVACWKVGLRDSSLTYQLASPLPGHNVDVKLDGSCARGYCMPQGSKLPADGLAHLAWNLEGSQVAVLAGDDVHLFNGQSKEHLSSFTIRGDKGPTGPVTGVNFLGDYIIVQAGELATEYVWIYKTDGTAMGAVTPIGGGANATPISIHKGSLLLLNKDSIALAEQGFSTVTTYELANGKRSKLVRKVDKPACKASELEDYWHDGDNVSDKCRASMTKSYEHLIGATGLRGAKSMLLVLRGPRLGELGVLDPKTLSEKSSIKLPWCDGGTGSSSASSP